MAAKPGGSQATSATGVLHEPQAWARFQAACKFTTACSVAYVCNPRHGIALKYTIRTVLPAQLIRNSPCCEPMPIPNMRAAHHRAHLAVRRRTHHVPHCRHSYTSGTGAQRSTHAPHPRQTPCGSPRIAEGGGHEPGIVVGLRQGRARPLARGRQLRAARRQLLAQPVVLQGGLGQLPARLRGRRARAGGQC